MRFDVPESFFQRLRDRTGRALDHIEREHDAVILDGGLGTALYLTRAESLIALIIGVGWLEK